MTLSANALSILFAGQELLLHPSGALFWPDEKMLIVSDLHLEKGSFLAQFGSALPHYDSRDTLLKLQQVMHHFQPQQVVCLGDSFHDSKALARLSAEDGRLLSALVNSCPKWLWVLGNHDAAMEQAFAGETALYADIAGIRLAHEPDGDAKAQIIGHFHPKTTLALAGRRVRGKCLLVNKDMLIMPAFGSFTGGLDSSHKSIRSLSPHPFTRFLIYRNRIWKV